MNIYIAYESKNRNRRICVNYLFKLLNNKAHVITDDYEEKLNIIDKDIVGGK